MASLNELVHQLARPHKTIITRDGGTKELVDVIPLIHQLRMACRQDNRGDGASGHSTGPSAPIAVGATQDYRDALETVQAWHVHITGQNYGSLEQQLIAWATWAQSPTITAHEPNQAVVCAAWCQKLVSKIGAMLHPVRRGEIIGQCPACNCTEAWDNIDGERTRIGNALAAIGGVVKCLNCGESWAGQDMYTLAAKLRAVTQQKENALHLQPQLV